MSRLALVRRDLGIVLRAVWLNLALFAGLLLGVATLMWACRAYPGARFMDLVVDSFHMAILERVAAQGDSLLPQVLTFAVPALSVVIVGEGVLRVLAVYLFRDQHREEWDTMLAQSFFGHTVLCGVGELGRAVCRRLVARDPAAQVVLIDTRPAILEELGLQSPNVCHLQADMTSQATLEAAHCQKAALVIAASGNDATNLEAGFKALRLNPQAEVWIRLYRSELAGMLDLSTKPNVHFFCPYERAAEALVGGLYGPEM